MCVYMYAFFFKYKRHTRQCRSIINYSKMREDGCDKRGQFVTQQITILTVAISISQRLRRIPVSLVLVLIGNVLIEDQIHTRTAISMANSQIQCCTGQFQ